MGKLEFKRPVDDRIGDGYGGRDGTHYGLDYLAVKGTTVHASERGQGDTGVV